MACAKQDNSVEEYICRQMEQYPLMTMQDVYKAFYQDRFGAGHMIADTASVRDFLSYELTVAAEDSVSNPYYEVIGPQGNCVRVYLRCVNEGLLTEEQLLDAFIRSAQPTVQPEQPWEEEWSHIEKAAHKAGISCSDDERQLIRKSVESNQPIHHSTIYHNTYHPHYRIVARTIFDNELKPHIDK